MSYMPAGLSWPISGTRFRPTGGVPMPKSRMVLQASLLGGLKAGDVVMVKGSLGSRMGPLVEAMRAQFIPADKDSR